MLGGVLLILAAGSAIIGEALAQEAADPVQVINAYLTRLAEGNTQWLEALIDG